MQPYSELANWDGSLEDVVDSLGPPSPSDSPSLAHDDPPMYDQYRQSNQQVGISHAHLSLNPANSNALKKKMKRIISQLQQLRRIYPHYRILAHHPTHHHSSPQAPPSRNHHHQPSSFRHKNARLWLISRSIPMMILIQSSSPVVLHPQPQSARGHGRR